MTTPSALESRPDRLVREAVLSGPVLQGQFSAIEGVIGGRAPVTDLLLLSRPSAVLRRVAKIVVNSIQGRACWLWSHVGVEGTEGIPLFADRNAATSIVFVSGIPDIGAATPHRHPRTKLRRSSHAVNRLVGNRHFPFPAAA